MDYLFDAGVYENTGMGRAQLSHGELVHWQHNAGIELTAWEASTLRTLSAAYVQAAQEAEEPDCKPPYAAAAEVQALRRAEVNSKLDEFLN